VKNTLIILVAFGFPLFFVRGSSRFTGQTSSLSKNICHCFDQDNYTTLTSLTLGFTARAEHTQLYATGRSVVNGNIVEEVQQPAIGPGRFLLPSRKGEQ